MPFRVHQFGTPVPSLRSSQPRICSAPLAFPSLLLTLRPFSSDALYTQDRTLAVVGREEAGRSFPGRTCYPGIGKRFIFPALFSPSVRLPRSPRFIPRVAAIRGVSFWFFVMVKYSRGGRIGRAVAETKRAIVETKSAVLIAIYRVHHNMWAEVHRLIFCTENFMKQSSKNVDSIFFFLNEIERSRGRKVMSASY